MKKIPQFAPVALVLVVALSAGAQQQASFAVHPEKREQEVNSARERAHREKVQAQEWAATHGKAMRFDNGKRSLELMAIRGSRHVWYTTENYNAAISTAADLIRNTAPYSVDGSGLAVGIWDAGSVMSTHQELVGRVSVMDGAASNYHSTHVGGTIGASGVALGRQGMAPAVNIASYDWSNDTSEMNARSAATPGEAGAIYLSNHSYGSVCGWDEASWSGSSGWHWPYWLLWQANAVDPAFGQYNLESKDYDQAVYNAPYFLPFVAAGNDRNDGPANGETVYYSVNNGSSWKSTTYNSTLQPLADESYKGGYDTLKPGAVAKNVVTVGAVYDAVTGTVRDLSKAGMTTFTGWGPADDGRIKPDIVANGYVVYSCYNTSTTAYQGLSGTSMATPNVCGSAALLVDWYSRLFPGQYMRASTLKGLILHTADDLGNPGPDYAYGWGLMNTQAAADLIAEFASGDTNRMSEDYITSLDTTRTRVISSDGSSPLRITLCWTDPPSTRTTAANDSRLPRLVNDLDLTVTGPDGTHYPFSLSYADPTANATTTVRNSADNVEQVYLKNPAAGEYTITVNYAGTVTGESQWFSLLVSGDFYDSDGDEMPDYWETAYFASPTGAVATVDSDGDGRNNLSEFVSGSNPTSTVSLFSIGVHELPSVASNTPIVLNWESVEGRVYHVGWSTNLSSPFINVSGDLPYPAASYTDTVIRTGPNDFYKLDVRIGP